jgi:xylan 1,4-beta-xylosidase
MGKILAFFMSNRNLSRSAAILVTTQLICWATAIQVGAQESKTPATYRNPLLPDVQMADPHVIKVDKTYYLYATTHTRAYEVFTSPDLVNWTLKTEVFNDPRRGLWAPDVFHDVEGNGKFYLYYTANTQNPPSGPGDKVVGVAESDSPLGPFVDRGVLASNSIDGHLFYDAGKYYFYYADIKSGFKIMAQPMSDPVTREGKPVRIIHPTEPWEKEGNVTEGPFMLKRGDTFYMMYSGTRADSPNYAIGYATSKSPMGPFKKYEGNPIASRTSEVLGPGHHCVIEGPDKQLWMVYHQKWKPEIGWRRFLALDRIWFNDQGALETEVSRGVDRPAPRMPAKSGGS